MKELSLEGLKKAQIRASKESIRITQAMGMPYYTVKKGYLYMIQPDGTEQKIRKAVFGTRKINQKKMKIDNGNKTF